MQGPGNFRVAALDLLSYYGAHHGVFCMNPIPVSDTNKKSVAILKLCTLHSAVLRFSMVLLCWSMWRVPFLNGVIYSSATLCNICRFSFFLVGPRVIQWMFPILGLVHFSGAFPLAHHINILMPCHWWLAIEGEALYFKAAAFFFMILRLLFFAWNWPEGFKTGYEHDTKWVKQRNIKKLTQRLF